MNPIRRWPRPLLACLAPLVLLFSGCGGGGSDGGATPPAQFTLGGSISGLVGNGLVLANGSDTVAVTTTATSFTLPTSINSGSSFSIVVQVQPSGQTCSVANGTGTVGAANVSNVTVVCNSNVFRLGGTITGLASNGLLLANGSDTVAVAADATAFTLAAAVAFGSAYNVTVKTQTDDQTCTITNGAGTMGDGDVSNVTVTCVAASFSAVSTFAGSGQQGSADGKGTSASFFTPAGVVTDPSGNFYVTDADNNLIRKITPDGTVSTVAGSGVAGRQDGTGTAASFRGPTGIAIDASGNLFVADRLNNQIRKITADGVVTTLVKLQNSPFDQPQGVAVDAAGNLYATDSGHHTIHKIAPDGTRIVLAGITGVSGSTDGPGASATFNQPFGLAIDASGTLYVADRRNHKIRKIAPDGTVSTLAGSGNPALPMAPARRRSSSIPWALPSAPAATFMWPIPAIRRSV